MAAAVSVIVGLAALAISGGKLFWAEQASRTMLGCAWCVSHKALPHELQWLLTLLALHLASGSALVRGWFVGALLRAIVFVLLLLAVADLLVLDQFLVRLTLGEAMKFVGEPQAVRGYVEHGSLAALAATTGGLVAAALLGGAYVRAGARAEARRFPLWMAGAAAAGAVGAAAAKVEDLHTPYLQNSIEAFFAPQSRHRPYSAAFASSVPEPARDPQRCFDGLGQRPDVILLMVESLSAYHSARLSGLADWTPALDRLGAEGLWFADFFANGVNSEQALIALLTGEPPIERPGGRGRTLFEAFMAPRATLPRVFAAAGYSTRFISGFNLDFPGLQPWLHAVGFDRVEGHEAPFFRGRPGRRMHFDSVPDALLFDRLLHELALPRDGPLFVTAFTQSTHHPYIDPDSGTRTEEAAFRYVDRELARFVAALRTQRFFDNGVLLIVGDHRAMQPMGSRERARFGDRGFVRVPMLVLGGPAGSRAPQVVSGAYSQTDVLPSLRHLVGRTRVCLSADQGLFLPREIVAPACVYTLRAYGPDLVFAHCGGTDLAVELDGDRTGAVGAPSPAAAAVVGAVNRLRLGKGF